MIRVGSFVAINALILLFASIASAQAPVRLVGRNASQVELVYGKRSVIFDLEEALVGTNGSLPGKPPHRYTVLFAAEKGDMVYVVANVQSASPVSDKRDPCGDDRPQALLWVEAERSLKMRRVQSEIYASCRYNYFDSKLKRDKSGVRITIGGRRKLELRYDHANPERGLTMKTVD